MIKNSSSGKTEDAAGDWGYVEGLLAGLLSEPSHDTVCFMGIVWYRRRETDCCRVIENDTF